MATETIQDTFDSMSADQKDAAALIFGALEADETGVNADTLVSGNKNLGSVYNSLSLQQKVVVDFLAAGIGPDVAHSDLDAFLAHHGIKGMHWGVRRPEDSSGRVTGSSEKLSARVLGQPHTKSLQKYARANVKSNSASLGTAHIAALKTRGHRAANFILGDKTYWKRTAILTGAVLGGVAAAYAAPAVLPTHTLMALGAKAISAGFISGGHSAVSVAGYTITSKAAILATGKEAATAIGLAAAGTANIVGGVHNAAGNTMRAVLGNSRINKSYEKLGDNVRAHQSHGSKKVQKILKQNGSVKVMHDDLSLDDFLEHYGIKGMHWGVRRQPGTDGLVAPSSDAKPEVNVGSSADHERAVKALAKAGEKGRGALSNEEIAQITKRLEAEKKFNQLTGEQKSELQKQVDAMKLQKEYRQLKAEQAIASRSTGRKMIDSLLKGGIDAATNVAADLGKDMARDMLGLNVKDPKTKLKSEIELMKLQKEHRDLSKDLGKFANATATKTASGKVKFRVNPNKVKVTPTILNNLPKLKRH